MNIHDVGNNNNHNSIMVKVFMVLVFGNALVKDLWPRLLMV